MHYELFFYFLHISYVMSQEENVMRKTLPTPNFRKQVEEISEDISTKYSHERNEDTGQNLVSLMVKNIRELFHQSEVPTLIFEAETEFTDNPITITAVTGITRIVDSNKSKEHLVSNVKKNYVINTTLSTLLAHRIKKSSTRNIFFKKIIGDSESEPSDRLLLELENRKEEESANIIKSSDLSDKTVFSSVNEMITTKRSCIACNNILLDECNDPKNKLIPSKVCKKDEDVCYSRHTPFGLVERGCFNTNNNLTTYVCSCNLCNYVSMTDMPYAFSSKQEWIKNVIELSRTKRFRKTIFKEMSCLMCEVNVTSNAIDVTFNANCLEGNVDRKLSRQSAWCLTVSVTHTCSQSNGVLPTQECAENEICGVKVIKSKGYVWRGCLTLPLYNHWWTLCETDLCNYDSIVSMSD